MEVTDGDKGCDRAAFFFKCFTENGQKVIEQFFPIIFSFKCIKNVLQL